MLVVIVLIKMMHDFCRMNRGIGFLHLTRNITHLRPTFGSKNNAEANSVISKDNDGLNTLKEGILLKAKFPHVISIDVMQDNDSS